MHRWAVALLVAGCYAPRVPAGSPCDDDSQCPRELHCGGSSCVEPGAPGDAAIADAGGWSMAIPLRGVNEARR